VDGQKIASRKRIPAGTRFVADRSTGLIHDLARERPYCGLEDAFRSGTAEAFMRPLSKAKSTGLRVDEACIGGKPNDTFDGSKTVLLQMYAPPRDPDVLRDLNERLDFHLRLAIGFERHGDRPEMHERLARLKIPAVFYQAMRITYPRRDNTVWGEPSATIEVNAAAGPGQDVLADLFIPRALDADEASIDRLAQRVMNALFRVKSVRTAFAKHFVRHGYRRLLVHGHVCDTVDEWIVPRPRADCGQDTGGSSWHGGDGYDCY
jgi:hypothetical protein